MRFIASQRKNNYSKCSAFASFALFTPMFHFKLRSFGKEGARIFLAPGRRVP